jgi:hypothetical protein
MCKPLYFFIIKIISNWMYLCLCSIYLIFWIYYLSYFQLINLWKLYHLIYFFILLVLIIPWINIWLEHLFLIVLNISWLLIFIIKIIDKMCLMYNRFCCLTLLWNYRHILLTLLVSIFLFFLFSIIG